MSSHYCLQSVDVIELLTHVLAKNKPRTSRTRSPTCVVVRVAPQQVTHRAFVRDLLYSINLPNAVESVKLGTETSMKTKQFILNETGQRKVVEYVSEVLPDVGVPILAETLVVKAIDLGNRPCLVITP